MNLKAHHPGFKIWSGAKADIDRIATIWRECLATWKGPYLFGKLSIADAMYAPVVTRFLTYDVTLDTSARPMAGASWRSPTWSSGSSRRAPSPTRSRSSTSSSDEHHARHAQRDRHVHLDGRTVRVGVAPVTLIGRVERRLLRWAPELRT